MLEVAGNAGERRGWGRVRALVLLLAVALVITGMRGEALASGPAAPAQAAASDGDCAYRDGAFDPPLCDQGLYDMTDGQRAAIGRLYELALQRTGVRYGMDPALSRGQLLSWGKDEVRSELATMLIDAAVRTDRTADESVALGWYAETLQKRNVFAAEAALAEYKRYYGVNEGTGRVPEQACTYVPPAPFQSEYKPLNWVGCQPNGRPGLFDLGPKIPSQDDFTRWGLASVAYRTTPAEMVGLSAAAREAVAAAATAVAAGTAIAGLVALNLAVTVPFASTLASGTAGVLAFGLTPYAYLSGTTLAAGTVVGVAAIVVIAATLLAMTTIRVVDASQVGAKLTTGLDRARTVQPDVPAALRSLDGFATLLVDLGRVERRFTSGGTQVVPVRAPVDPVVVVADRNGVPGPRTDRFQHLALTGAGYTVDTRQLAGGWFVDPTGARVPRASIIVEPWDPSPPVVNGVRVPRPGFDFPASVSVVSRGGRAVLSVMTLGRSGYPKRGADCNDLDADGCWTTDAVPFLDGSPSTIGQQKFLRLQGNQAPAAPSGGPVAMATEGDTVALPASGLSDPDGDAVTPVWEVLDCPERTFGLGSTGCSKPADTASSSLPVSFPGRYTVRLSARDAFGAVTAGPTSTVDVRDLAPRLVTTSSSGSSVPQGTSWSVSLRADRGPFRGQVAVDWDDGTTGRSSTLSLDPLQQLFQGSHTWQRAGHYDVTATISDAQGTATTVVPVDVTPVSPTITVTRSTVPLGGSAPGSLVSIAGDVLEPGTTDPVRLELRWYDGQVQTLDLQPTGTARRPWGADRVVTVSTSRGVTLPFPTDLVTVRALAPDGSVDPGTPPVVVRGIVNDFPPVFSGTTGAPAVAGQPSRLTGDVQDPNGDGVRLVVDWGDGTTPDLLLRPAGSGPLDLRHTFAQRGTYAVTLSAQGTLDPPPPPSPTTIDPYPTVVATVSMVVPEAQPALLGAAFRGRQVEGSLNRVPLDLTLGAGPAGRIRVDWGDGSSSTADVDGSGGTLSLVKNWPQDGSYDVVVTAERPDGTSRLVLAAQQVDNAPPNVGSIVRPGLPSSTPELEATPVFLELPVLDVPADTLTAVVDWGDGTVEPAPVVPPVLTAGLLVRASHSYARAAFYRITITVTDDAGASATALAFRLVQEAAPQLARLAVVPGPEGASTRVTADVRDGAGDLGAVGVDWGDGTVESVTYDEAHQLSAGHVYADDGTYTVRLVPHGDDGLDGRELVRDVVVVAVAPALSVTGPPALDEGTTEVLGVAITDPGPDGGTVAVSWGDGTPDTEVAYGPAERSLSVGHAYADDDPSGTASDVLSVAVSAVDDDGLPSGPSRLAVTVRDVAPRLTTAKVTDQLGRALGPDRPAVVDGETRVLVDAADASAVDALTGQVRWPGGAGDALVDARGSHEVSRRLQSAGSTSATLTVRDDDGRSTIRSLPLTVVTRATALRRAGAALTRVASEGGVPQASVTKLKDASRRLSVAAAQQPGDPVACLDQVVQALQAVSGLTGGRRVALLSDTRLDIALAARAVGQTAVEAAAARAASSGTGQDLVAGARAALLGADVTLLGGDTRGAALAVQSAVLAVS